MPTRPKSIRRKRFELVLLSLLVLLTFSGTVIVFGLSAGVDTVFIGFLGLLVLLFSGYLIESEMRLGKLQEELFRERMQTLEEQARQSALGSRVKELTALYNGMETVGREDSPDKALARILETVMGLFAADRGSILLLEKSSDELVIAVSKGLPAEVAQNTRVKLGDSIAGRVAETGEPLMINGTADPEVFSNLVMKSPDLNSGLCAPLRTRNRVIGVINCGLLKKANRRFTENDLQLLMVFAQFSAVILEHAYLTMAARRAAAG